MSSDLRIGTCSWKYPSWSPLVYSRPTGINYLAEYAQSFNTVEIDQWFYNFPELPVAEDYYGSVGSDFLFTIKVPRQITLTHKRSSASRTSLQENPDFLSPVLFEQFIRLLGPLKAKTGMLIFQFEYLNKKKMPSLRIFLEKWRNFLDKIGNSPPLAIEIRNKNYLSDDYFRFLEECNVSHVFNEFYYMPHIWEVWENLVTYTGNNAVVRLLGGNRKEIETLAADSWDRVVMARDDDLERIASLLDKMLDKNLNLFVNINNHYEGAAPLTIGKLNKFMSHH